MIGVIGWFLAPETLAPSAARETAPLPIGGGLSLPPTRPGARHFSGLPSTRPSFNTHSSRSGSVQRILSAVPAPALYHFADVLGGRAPPIECSSLSVATNLPYEERAPEPLRGCEVCHPYPVQRKPVKTGGRLVKHARYYWLMLAESHLTRRLFGAMVRRIDALELATG